MKKGRLAVLFAAISVLAVAIGTNDIPNNIYATSQSAVEQAEAEAAEIQQKIDELSEQLANLETDITSTQNYVQELDSTLSQMTENIIAYNNLISAKQAEIDTKQAEIDTKQAEIDASEANLVIMQANQEEQYEAMKLRIQYMYESGEESFLDLIFSAGDLSELLGNAEYVSQITEYDRDKLEEIELTAQTIAQTIAQLETDRQNLVAEKSVLETQQSELVALKTDLEVQQSYTNTLLGNKETALASLENMQSTTANEITAEEAKLEAQKAEAARLKKQWEAQQAAASAGGGNADADNAAKLAEIGLAGGFTWPLTGFNYISSHFGPRNLQLGHLDLGNHSGIDIAGAGVYGQPVIAAYDGTISLTDSYGGNMYSQPYGNRVEIDHGAGVVTLYAHLSKIAVTQGQTVKAGDIIGYVGSTGASTGAHLHLTLYIKGVLVDPEDYFTIPTY